MNLDFGDRPKLLTLMTAHRQAFEKYASQKSLAPLLLHGDAVAVLKNLPEDSVDCAMTSPPYWGKREYENGGIGLETDNRLARFVLS
jgi:site-specific DNA-methyltransferase (adenine-specific)